MFATKKKRSKPRMKSTKKKRSKPRMKSTTKKRSKPRMKSTTKKKRYVIDGESLNEKSLSLIEYYYDYRYDEIKLFTNTILNLKLNEKDGPEYNKINKLIKENVDSTLLSVGAYLGLATLNIVDFVKSPKIKLKFDTRILSSLSKEKKMNVKHLLTIVNLIEYLPIESILIKYGLTMKKKFNGEYENLEKKREYLKTKNIRKRSFASDSLLDIALNNEDGSNLFSLLNVYINTENENEMKLLKIIDSEYETEHEKNYSVDNSLFEILDKIVLLIVSKPHFKKTIEMAILNKLKENQKKLDKSKPLEGSDVYYEYLLDLKEIDDEIKSIEKGLGEWLEFKFNLFFLTFRHTLLFKYLTEYNKVRKDTSIMSGISDFISSFFSSRFFGGDYVGDSVVM